MTAMRCIANYPLEPGACVVHMPAGAETLSIDAGEPGGSPRVWALVDHDAPLEPRRLLVLLGWSAVGPDVRASQYVGRMDVWGQSYHVFDQQRA